MAVLPYFIDRHPQKFTIFRQHRVREQPINDITWPLVSIQLHDIGSPFYEIMKPARACIRAFEQLVPSTETHPTRLYASTQRDTRINMARSRVQFSADWFCWMLSFVQPVYLVAVKMALHSLGPLKTD